jgi:hypothetical protein
MHPLHDRLERCFTLVKPVLRGLSACNFISQCMVDAFDFTRSPTNVLLQEMLVLESLPQTPPKIDMKIAGRQDGQERPQADEIE